MRKQALFGLIVLGALLGTAVGCGGGEKKPDDGGPAPTPNEKEEPGDPDAKAPAEKQFKLSSAEFVKEYAKNPRGANAKYKDALVELSGNVTRSAGVELDAFGKPAGKPGEYKASFALGEWDAKRAETVVVRGAKSSAVGQVLRGQDVRVKGRVAKHQSPHPVELLDAEVISPGTDRSISLNDKGWSTDVNREKLYEVCAKLTGTVEGKGNDGGEYLVVSGENISKMRCHLMDGVGVLFPSGFPAGTKVRLAGVLKYEVVDKDKPFADQEPVLRDCVPLDRDPKAK